MCGKMMVRSSLDDMNDFDMRKLHFHHGTSVITIAFARAISDASNPLPPPAVSRSVSMSQTPMTNQPSLGRQARSADSLAKTPIYIYIGCWFHCFLSFSYISLLLTIIRFFGLHPFERINLKSNKKRSLKVSRCQPPCNRRQAEAFRNRWGLAHRVCGFQHLRSCFQSIHISIKGFALKRSLKKVWTVGLLTFAFTRKNVATIGLEIPTPVCQCKPILCFQSQGKMKSPLVYCGLGMSRTLLNAYECVISSNWSGLGPTDPPGGFGDVGRNSYIAIAIYTTHENDSTTDSGLILEVPWFYRPF